MHIVLTLELGCERFIYTAFVKLCNKHEDNAWNAPYWTASTNIPSLSTTPDKTSTVTVFTPSLLFKTGVDCRTVLEVSSKFIPWTLFHIDLTTADVTCESPKCAARTSSYVVRNVQ